MKISDQWIEKINQLEYKNDVAIVEHSNFAFVIKRILDPCDKFSFSIMVYNRKQDGYYIENFTYNGLTFFYIEIVNDNLFGLMYKNENAIIGITYKILFVFKILNSELNEFYYNIGGKVLYKILRDKLGLKIKQIKYFFDSDKIKTIHHFKSNYLLNCDNGPAVIKYNEEGEVSEKYFYRNGTYICSNECPGYINYKNGKVTTSFFYNKVVFNRKKFPATYEFEFDKEKCIYVCICWFKNGKLHNDFGPAKIIIDQNKNVKELFYLNGDNIVDELAIELIRVKENEIVKKIRKNLVKLCKIEEA